MARTWTKGHNYVVILAAWGSYSFLFGPVVSMLGIGVLVLILRWGWSRGHSVVERPIRPAAMDDYGMLTAVATPNTVIEAEMLKQHLVTNGIRATVAITNVGPRVMVWPESAPEARKLLQTKGS